MVFHFVDDTQFKILRSVEVNPNVFELLFTYHEVPLAGLMIIDDENLAPLDANQFWSTLQVIRNNVNLSLGEDVEKCFFFQSIWKRNVKYMIRKHIGGPNLEEVIILFHIALMCKTKYTDSTVDTDTNRTNMISLYNNFVDKINAFCAENPSWRGIITIDCIYPQFPHIIKKILSIVEQLHSKAGTALSVRARHFAFTDNSLTNVRLAWYYQAKLPEFPSNNSVRTALSVANSFFHDVDDLQSYMMESKLKQHQVLTSTTKPSPVCPLTTAEIASQQNLGVEESTVQLNEKLILEDFKTAMDTLFPSKQNSSNTANITSIISPNHGHGKLSSPRVHHHEQQAVSYTHMSPRSTSSKRRHTIFNQSPASTGIISNTTSYPDHHQTQISSYTYYQNYDPGKHFFPAHHPEIKKFVEIRESSLIKRAFLYMSEILISDGLLASAPWSLTKLFNSHKIVSEVRLRSEETPESSTCDMVLAPELEDERKAYQIQRLLNDHSAIHKGCILHLLVFGRNIDNTCAINGTVRYLRSEDNDFFATHLERALNSTRAIVHATGRDLFRIRWEKKSPALTSAQQAQQQQQQQQSVMYKSQYMTNVFSSSCYTTTAASCKNTVTNQTVVSRYVVSNDEGYPFFYTHFEAEQDLICTDDGQMVFSTELHAINGRGTRCGVNAVLLNLIAISLERLPILRPPASELISHKYFNTNVRSSTMGKKLSTVSSSFHAKHRQMVESIQKNVKPYSWPLNFDSHPNPFAYEAGKPQGVETATEEEEDGLYYGGVWTRKDSILVNFEFEHPSAIQREVASSPRLEELLRIAQCEFRKVFQDYVKMAKESNVIQVERAMGSGGTLRSMGTPYLLYFYGIGSAPQVHESPLTALTSIHHNESVIELGARGYDSQEWEQGSISGATVVKS